MTTLIFVPGNKRIGKIIHVQTSTIQNLELK